MTLNCFGCEAGQSVPIRMKFKLDLLHYCLLDVYSKSQINISKHVEKSPKNFEKSKTPKIIAKIPKIILKNKQTELISRSIQWATYVPNLKDLLGHDCKK